jgi:hypothetical protein
MGKQMLIIVLGISVIISILIMNLNANVHQGLDETLNFYNNTQARLIANSGIEIYLAKMRNDKNLKGTFLNNQLLNGKYDVWIYGPDDDLKLKSIATYDGYVHTSLATARRRPVQIPTVNSALYISTSNMILQLNGNVDVNGNDFNMNGTPGTGAPLPGVGLDTESDSTYFMNNVKPKITTGIYGYGGNPSVYSVNNTTNWLNITEDFIFSADTVLNTGNYSKGSQFGTASQPIITYCNGDVGFSDASGYGVMIVNGNLNLSGNFNFYGIVIVYGQSTIRTNSIGNNAIIGATILVGNTVEIESQGNSKYYYSSQAIANAQMNLKSSRFEVLSWWE